MQYPPPPLHTSYPDYYLLALFSYTWSNNTDWRVCWSLGSCSFQCLHVLGLVSDDRICVVCLQESFTVFVLYAYKSRLPDPSSLDFSLLP